MALTTEQLIETLAAAGIDTPDKLRSFIDDAQAVAASPVRAFRALRGSTLAEHARLQQKQRQEAGDPNGTHCIERVEGQQPKWSGTAAGGVDLPDSSPVG